MLAPSFESMPDLRPGRAPDVEQLKANCTLQGLSPRARHLQWVRVIASIFETASLRNLQEVKISVAGPEVSLVEEISLQKVEI